ncbi:MAG: cytochrome c biogenesis heme-transporting ATPase CcmA [Methylotenera sp.]|jgi:heme exporter protein A|nr:cytochrome c biogenesis heme-transporting ATPase CcmA [Methylotenera sp.]
MLEAITLECRRGGRKLFSGLSLSLSPGQLLHVQGSNGSGKTSLLRILAGLSRQDSGKIFWNNTDIHVMRDEYASMLLYLGHQPAVKDDLTVTENLLVTAQIGGVNPTPNALKSAIEVVGLSRQSNLPARVLSQGQRRRLALARLWLDNKPLWILDEPFTALDVEATALLEARLETHLATGGMVVLTTHQSPSITENYLCVLRLEP